MSYRGGVPRTPQSPRASAARRLRRSAGALSTLATAGMDEQLPWFRELSAEDRSWVGLIVQAGVQGFVEWYAAGADAAHASGGPEGGTELAASVFGAAPRALTGVITLQQTVDLVRLTIDVVEASVDEVLEGEDADAVHAAILRYAREVAFATAEVYARAAESRGAWDARLEALVVDAVLRSETDETLLSRASALGWQSHGDVAVVIGHLPARRSEADVFEQARHLARAQGLDALCAAQGDRLVLLLGGVTDPRSAATALLASFDERAPVVVGPVVSDLAQAQHSARAAQTALRTSAGWPDAPRPVLADELLPERVLGGDGHARRHLVEEVYLPLLGSSGAVETLHAYLEGARSIEAAARALFVHANTVRYRLRRITELTGHDPTTPRGGLVLQLALVLGRQSGRVRPDVPLRPTQAAEAADDAAGPSDGAGA